MASWHEALGDPTMADAVLDRVVHNAYKIELKGEDSMRKLRSEIDVAETMRDINQHPAAHPLRGWPTSIGTPGRLPSD